MFLLIKKNIVVITNTIIHSSNFYFGHFVGAEAIPQSFMLSFSSQNQILGFLKLFRIPSITKIK